MIILGEEKLFLEVQHMRKTDRLYTDLGHGGKSYDFSSHQIEWDSTWSMQNNPYPPEPNYNFYIEDKGVIIKILEIWTGYFEALFYYAETSDLLDSDFGKIWYEFCWIGNDNDDWLIESNDLNDFLSICENMSLYNVSGKQQKAEQIFLPETQVLHELREYLIRFLKSVSEKEYLIYFNRD